RTAVARRSVPGDCARARAGSRIRDAVEWPIVGPRACVWTEDQGRTQEQDMRRGRAGHFPAPPEPGYREDARTVAVGECRARSAFSPRNLGPVQGWAPASPAVSAQPSILQKKIDAAKGTFRLLLCGSSQRMMHGLVLDANAP